MSICSCKEVESVTRSLGVGLKAVINRPRVPQIRSIGFKFSDRAGHSMCWIVISHYKHLCCEPDVVSR